MVGSKGCVWPSTAAMHDDTAAAWDFVASTWDMVAAMDVVTVAAWDTTSLPRYRCAVGYSFFNIKTEYLFAAVSYPEIARKYRKIF